MLIPIDIGFDLFSVWHFCANAIFIAKLFRSTESVPKLKISTTTIKNKTADTRINK